MATAASNPTLASLVAAYAQLTPPAGTPDVGNPAGLPSFSPGEPAYVFYTAGPKAIPAIFTGPGLQRAVFNAALAVQEHGPVQVSGWPPVCPAVTAAVAAYVAAHPAEVPVGNSDPGTVIVGDATPVGGTPAVLTPAQIAAAQAFDAKIAAQDAGKGSVPVSSVTAQDLQYAGAVLGDQFGAFLRSYTSDSNTTINQTIGAYLVGGPQAAPSNAVPAGSAKITAAVAAFKAANVPTRK